MRINVLALLSLCAVAPLAFAGEAHSNATVQPAGPRTGANGVNFFNIEGSINGAFASYGVARFDMAADKAALDATYGVGGWTVTGATLTLFQANAAFSFPGTMKVYFSGEDTKSILNNGTSPLVYDVNALPGGNSQGPNGIVREETELTSYVFTQQGAGNNGTMETYSLTLTPGLLSRLQSGSSSSTVTLVFEGQDATVAATYAGVGHNQYAGPTLTITGAPAATCGTSDYNGDGDFGTDADIESFFACLAGACCETCFAGGSDFNADGDFGTDADIESFFRVLAGGEC